MENFPLINRDHQNHHRRLTAACLILIGLLGFFLRMEDLLDWKEQPERAFHKDNPLIRTIDGYYYLSLAEEIRDKTYQGGAFQKRRCLDRREKYPAVPPLISFMTAMTAKMTGASIHWIAVLLPPCAGILLLMPLYLLGRFYGGRICGVLASFFGLTSFYYLYRSSLGYYDTDILNVTLSISLIYFLIRFAWKTGSGRYASFSFAILTGLIFYWWWRPYAVTFLLFTPLFIALIFYYRNATGKEKLTFFTVLLSSLFILFIVFSLLDISSFRFTDFCREGIQRLLNYIRIRTPGDFPDAVTQVSELQRPDLMFMVRVTAGNIPLFIAGLAGLIWMIIRKPRESLFFIVPLCLGVLSLFAGRRFLIFLSPFFSLGLGFFGESLYRILEKKRKYIGSIALIVFLALNAPNISRGRPKEFLAQSLSCAG